MGINFDRKHLESARILVERIKNGEGVISYSELGNRIGIDTKELKGREKIKYLLGDLSCYSFDNGMPLISIMVVGKKNGRPGDGFYTLYKEKRGLQVKKNKDLTEEQKDKIFVDELNKVLAYDDWDRLIELLEKEFSPKIEFKRIKRVKPKFKLKLQEVKPEIEEIDFIEIDEFKELENMEFEEGQQIQKLMNTKKRNSKARQMKIEQFKKDNDEKVFCEVCNESDIMVLDVHHNSIQVCDMEEVQKTKLSDLRILCSNCHRKVHGYKISVEELKNKLNSK